MTNLEKYKDEIKNMYNAKDNELFCMCKISKLRKGNCGCTSCNDCNIESLEWLCEEYKEPKIKLTKMEYDLLTVCEDYKENLSVCGVLTRFKEKGNFKGVKDTTMLIRDILLNCEVVENVD